MSVQTIIHTFLIALILAVTGSFAQAQNTEHDMHKGHDSTMPMEHKGMDMHQMNKSSQPAMQMVKGKGILNKVMAEHHHVNISHEPIAELNWPKMKMNFQTDKAVNLSDLEPGQKVMFTLQVDDKQNYIIKEIMAE